MEDEQRTTLGGLAEYGVGLPAEEIMELLVDYHEMTAEMVLRVLEWGTRLNVVRNTAEGFILDPFVSRMLVAEKTDA